MWRVEGGESREGRTAGDAFQPTTVSTLSRPLSTRPAPPRCCLTVPASGSMVGSVAARMRARPARAGGGVRRECWVGRTERGTVCV